MNIVIDPGHGGYDPGAVGPSGLREKDVTLAVALLLADLLRQAGCEVVLTRDSDTTLWDSKNDLQMRCDIANKAGADLFVSIHTNAAGNPAATGTETYCYQRGSQGEQVATAIQQQLVAALGLPDRGVKTAGYYVLKYTAMPAVLVELAFISNPREEALLGSPDFRQEAAQAIAQGIARVLELNLNLKEETGPVISEWAKEAWDWAKKEGITDGTNPQGAVTREQVITMLYRLSKVIAK